MNLKLVIIGKTGQLARALTHEIPKHGHHGLWLDREALDLSWDEVKITQIIMDLPDDVNGVILAAAYTKVDQAETEPELAFKVNGAAPGVIARACQRRGLALVHISTDYVFDGKALSPYSPLDETAPINIYGKSKLLGEIAILESRARAVILRTSWVFDGTGRNFLSTMLRLAKTHKDLSIVDDQIGRPTFAGDLAIAAIRSLELLSGDTQFSGGIFHVTGGGDPVSWAGFAEAIFEQSKSLLSHSIRIKKISTDQYPTASVRPAYSMLDLRAFEKFFGYKLPDWNEGLKKALKARYAIVNQERDRS